MFTCTNKLYGMFNYIVYIRWLDKATNGKNRPDIYLSVIQRLEKDRVIKDICMDNYGNQVWENGVIANDGSGYDWKVTVSNLPKYDDEGYTYMYYSRESLNDHGSATGMGYKISYHKDTYNGDLHTIIIC